MSAAGVASNRQEVEADKAWSIELHAIEPIPLADRHGSPAELFRMWVGANINYVVLLTGALAVTQGLSFWGSISAIIIGNALGCLVVGLASIMGPKTGTAGIVASRSSFGQLGAILPTFISTLSALGWFSIQSVVATQSLAQFFILIGLPGTPLFSWIAMAVVLTAETLIAIYGHATIIAAEKWMALALAVMFVGLLAFLAPQMDWAQAMVGRKPGEANFATWLLVMGLIFSYPISWTNFASDYSRYLPKDTSWRAIARSAGGGQFVSLVAGEIIGVCLAVAIGGDLSDPVADLPKILPTWYMAPFLLAVILGAVAANVPNGYTAGLGLLALRLPMKRVTSLMVIATATLAFRAYTLATGRSFELYQQFLEYMLIWTCPWVAIVIVDYFIRKGEYDSADLMRWGGGRYWYRGGLFWPGAIAFALGLAASLAFSNSQLYASPLMTGYLGGTDLSFEAGIVVSAIVYYALARGSAARAAL
jgi:NCS1 family nucleobase:cation symporter-1